MKRKALKLMLGLTVAATLGMASPAVQADETEMVTGTAAETEAAETEAETEKAPDVDITQEGTVVLNVKNESGAVMTEAVLEAEEKDAQKGKLLLTQEDGTEHVFEDVDLAIMTEPVLVTEDGFFFIRYKENGEEEKTAYETADEAAFEEPVTMYAVNDVYIRAEADADSEALGVASLGKEYTVIAASPKWYKIQQDDLTGYVSRSFLSKDKESAEAAVKAEEAAVAQAQAAAAAAAASAAQSQAAASAPQGKYEVSRQAYDDCDGSGHGYYEITYSDGSTAIENY